MLPLEEEDWIGRGLAEALCLKRLEEENRNVRPVAALLILDRLVLQGALKRIP